MRAIAVETNQGSRSSEFLNKLRAATVAAREWVTAHSAPSGFQQLTPVRFVVIAAVIFVSALGVRLLYWQDDAVQLSIEDTLSQNMARQYRREARRIIEERTILFPRQQADPGNAMLIVHPPGYSMLMALSFRLFGETESPLRWLQISCDAAEAVLVFVIAAELLPLGVAVIAAALMALSPHASYYSIRLSPDSLAVLPVLFAVYLVIRASKEPRLLTVISAGLMLGLSCWLRANALLLAAFLGVVVAILFERRKRLLNASLLVAVTFLVISPITIRNWLVYHRFIPISLPAGVNLVQGIAEFDKEGRFGMPLLDPDVLKKDVEWNDRPDYGGHMWTPDGIERDRIRFERGLAVIRSHPLWFLGAVIRRANFMLSYNEARKRDWPFNTATVPVVFAIPPFGNVKSNTLDKISIISAARGDLLMKDGILSSNAEASLVGNGEVLRITGGGSEFEDQISSSAIAVNRNTDYVIAFSVRNREGAAAAKVIGKSEHVLASSILFSSELSSGPSSEAADRKGRNPTPEPGVTSVTIPFASGDSTEVHWVISNNGNTSVRPVIDVSKIEMFELGPTPMLWTHYPRLIVRGIQRNTFKTGVLLPLIIVGIALLAVARRGRTLLVLLIVPIYYLATHAPFSTEYRYVLAIHCFLFVMAAVTFYCVGLLIRRFIRLSSWRGMVPAKSAGYDASEST
jgi:dolichyl-phosphate-mannose-protein mannosyltransferase